MMDLATLLTQLNRNAHIMENIINAIHIPNNINQAGLAHCKEYLGRALDHMIKMGDAYRAISKQHPEDLDTLEVQAASARQIQMLAQNSALSTTLWKRTPTSEDSVPPAIQPIMGITKSPAPTPVTVRLCWASVSAFSSASLLIL